MGFSRIIFQVVSMSTGSAETPPSPKTIKAVTGLLQAAGQPADSGYVTVEHLHAISEIVVPFAWPGLIAFGLWVFRKKIRQFIVRVRTIGIAGSNIEAEEEIQHKIDSSAAERLSESTPSTAVGYRRARRRARPSRPPRRRRRSTGRRERCPPSLRRRGLPWRRPRPARHHVRERVRPRLPRRWPWRRLPDAGARAGDERALSLE